MMLECLRRVDASNCIPGFRLDEFVINEETGMQSDLLPVRSCEIDGRHGAYVRV